MPDRIQTLRQLLRAYLDDEFGKKTKEELTGRETAIIETSEALLALLLRQQKSPGTSASFDKTMADLMRGYREVSEDADVMSLMED